MGQSCERNGITRKESRKKIVIFKVCGLGVVCRSQSLNKALGMSEANTGRAEKYLLLCGRSLAFLLMAETDGLLRCRLTVGEDENSRTLF